MRKYILALLSICTVVPAMANFVILKNISKTNHEITVTYRIGYKDKGGKASFGKPITRTFSDEFEIFLDLNGRDLAGVSVQRVSAYKVPEKFQKLNDLSSCSATTSLQQPSALLELNYVDGKKPSISYSKKFNVSKIFARQQQQLG